MAIHSAPVSKYMREDISLQVDSFGLGAHEARLLTRSVYLYCNILLFLLFLIFWNKILVVIMHLTIYRILSSFVFFECFIISPTPPRLDILKIVYLNN